MQKMKCPKCQFENPVGAKFCNECGGKLGLVCTQCNKTNPPVSMFCNACGHNLNGLNRPPGIDYANPQSYTPKFLADKILTTRSSIEGERKLVTVLFADAANYTSISEKLDPEEIHQIMDGCFTILMEKTHKYEGTINQFTGDGIMALFGAPIARENHAQRACYAALSVRRAMEDYGKQIMADYGLEFKMRFGLNSGPVIVGSIGDDLRMDYTAVGDTTNLAKRMESIATPGSVILAQNTFRLVKSYFELEALGPVSIKGKESAQYAYALTDSSKVQTRFEESISKGYPLILTTGRVLEHWHTGTMSRRSRVLTELHPNGIVEMHPHDAIKLGLIEGDLIVVTSKRGQVEAPLHITEKSPPGLVFMPFHWREAAANVLTNDALDKVAKIPEFKVSAVNAVLAVLDRAASDNAFLARLAENPAEALEEYDLTTEEKAALMSGDIRKIESRLGKLDGRLKTWLILRLSQEKW